MGRALPQPVGENGTRVSGVDRVRVGVELLFYLTQKSSRLRALIRDEVLGYGRSRLTSSELREELQEVTGDWNLSGLYEYSGPEPLFLSQSRALGGPS